MQELTLMWSKVRTHKLALFLLSGFVVRILIAPYFTFVTLQDYQKLIESVFVLGLNPIPFSTTWGPGLYLFYLPAYVPYLVANYFGFSQPFILNFLLKIPPIVGDVIVFYALYNIGLIVSKSEKVSLGIAAAYFFNPLIIDQSVIVGLYHPLAVGFTMLSFLYLVKKKIGLSAICLGLSTSMSFLSVFLAPLYLIHLRREKSDFRRFIFMFMGSSFILFAPFLSFVIPIFLNFQSAFFDSMYLWFVGGFLGGPGGFLFFNMANAPSFFGFMWKLGIGPIFANLVNHQIFLSLFVPLYLIILILALRRSPSTRLITLCSITVLSLAAVARPISYPDLLLYVLPFLIVGAYVFRDLPKYYPIAVSVLALSTYFAYNPSHHLANTFGLWINLPTSSPLYFSMSVTYFFFLIVCIILSFYSILSMPRQEPSDKVNSPVSHENSSESSVRIDSNWRLVLLLLIYSLLEILRFGYTSGQVGISYMSAFIGISFVLTLIYSNYVRRRDISEYPCLFSSLFSRAVALMYMGILIAFLYMSIAFSFGSVSFLAVQILTIGVVWLVNRKSATGLNVLRISLIFTAIYVISLFYLPGQFYMMDTFPLLVTFLYLFSWIYLQFNIERTRHMTHSSDLVQLR
jgi:hypothetical protein